MFRTIKKLIKLAELEIVIENFEEGGSLTGTDLFKVVKKLYENGWLTEKERFEYTIKILERTKEGIEISSMI